MLKAGIGAVRRRVTPGALADPDVVLFATWISVWGRWFIWLVGVFLIAYRPGFWYPGDEEYLAIPVLLFVANGLVHYRLLTHRLVTWRWLLFLSAVDVALTTFGVGGGFASYIFLAYYPALVIPRRGLLVTLAQPRLRRRVPDGGHRPRPRRGQGEGAGGEVGGVVYRRPGHRPHNPVCKRCRSSGNMTA